MKLWAMLSRMSRASRLGAGIARCKVTGERRPLIVSFHITNRCNLRCPYCYANVDDRFDHPPDDMTTEAVKKHIDDLYDLGMRWLIILGGEPLIRKDIGEILRHTRKKGVLIEVVTNGHLVPKKIDVFKYVDFACLSLEGDEETHDKVRARKGSYQKVLNAAEVLSQSPYPVTIRFHATLMRENYEDLTHFKKITDMFPGSEFGFSQVIVHDYNDIESVSFTDDELLRFW